MLKGDVRIASISIAEQNKLSCFHINLLLVLETEMSIRRHVLDVSIICHLLDVSIMSCFRCQSPMEFIHFTEGMSLH